MEAASRRILSFTLSGSERQGLHRGLHHRAAALGLPEDAASSLRTTAGDPGGAPGSRHPASAGVRHRHGPTSSLLCRRSTLTAAALGRC